MNKLLLCVVMLALGEASVACPSSPAYTYTVGQATQAGVTVVQTEQQTGLLTVVGDVVSGVTTAIFGSTRTATTVATAAATVPVPSLGDVIPLQTKTKVFVPGRYVTTRSTYGEILRVWQPSHYAPVIAQSSALVVPQPIVVDKPPLDPTVVVVQPAPQRLQNVWIPGCYVDQPLVNGGVARVWSPGHYELR